MKDAAIAPIGVAIQQITTLMSPFHCMFFVARPIPAMAPTKACDVLIGSLRTVIRVAVIAAEIVTRSTVARD